MDFSRWKAGLKAALITVAIYLLLASFLYIVVMKLIYLFKQIEK